MPHNSHFNSGNQLSEPDVENDDQDIVVIWRPYVGRMASDTTHLVDPLDSLRVALPPSAKTTRKVSSRAAPSLFVRLTACQTFAAIWQWLLLVLLL